MAIKAVVFDLDGTLLDSEKLHTRFWMQAGKECGVDISYEDAVYIRSLSFHFAQTYFKEKFGKDFDLTPVRDRRRQIMDEYLKDHDIELKPYAKEILQYLKSKGIKTAVATSSKKENMEKFVKMVGIDDLLDMKISASMVRRGKPAPDIYTYVRKELGFEPSECIAVEDSPNGVRSAYDAGLNVVYIPDLTPGDEEIERKAKIYSNLLGLKELV